MLKLHFYNHKTLRHLKKQRFYHCCKCCLCKAYSPDTFQTHLVYINNNTNNNNNNFAEKKKKKSEGDREDANRPHGHLVKQPPNVRQIKKKKKT